jgi:hypothetical protein
LDAGNHWLISAYVRVLQGASHTLERLRLGLGMDSELDWLNSRLQTCHT